MKKYDKILHNLAEIECIKDAYDYADYCHEFCAERGASFGIDRTGTLHACGATLSPDQLDAVAKACKKIAANYKAEHGKEDE